MAVRKIPKNHLFVTGGFSSRKNGAMGQFESLLEKEFMMLLDFDECVESFEEQPVRICISGTRKTYVPDVLVYYLPDRVTGEIPPPFLTEIKHSSDIAKNSEKYAEKFASAEKYAQERGWTFGITTEKEIRSDRLANLKFLREYRNLVPLEEDCAHVIAAFSSTPSLSVEHLLQSLSKYEDERLHWFPVIWHLVLSKRLIADMAVRISETTILTHQA